MISINEFYDSYMQTLGIEGAHKLVDNSIRQVGLFVKKEYSKEEVIKVCDKLKQEKGFVRIVAGFIASRAMLDKNQRSTS